MREKVIISLIVAIGIVLGGYMVGGRYVIVPSPNSNAVARLDRFSGDVELCVPGTGDNGCGFKMD